VERHFSTQSGQVPVVEIVVTEQLVPGQCAGPAPPARRGVEPSNRSRWSWSWRNARLSDAAVIGLLVEDPTAQSTGRAEPSPSATPPPRLRRNLEIARVDHVLHVVPETVG